MCVAPGGRFDLFQMSGAARGASDVIDVMRGDSGSPGVGSRLPQRKRVKTKRAMESMQQENDMNWDEENSSERTLRNHKNRIVQDTVAVGKSNSHVSTVTGVTSSPRRVLGARALKRLNCLSLISSMP